MSELKPKSIDPLMVDVCLTNNPKLTALFTSYQRILNMFPMETLISYTNKYNKHVHDPVMAEKSFYENLNNQDELAVKLEYIDNPDIEADKLVTDEYWETQNTSYSEVTDDQYTDEPNYPWQLPEDKKSEEANLKEVLDKDVQFILFWVEKFRCIHQSVKNEYYVTNPNETPGGMYNNSNVYFNNFNESMFHLRDPEFIKDRSTSLMLDKDNVKNGAPSTYNRCLMNNIDVDTYDTATDIAAKASSKFKTNMKHTSIDLKKDLRV